MTVALEHPPVRIYRRHGSVPEAANDDLWKRSWFRSEWSQCRRESSERVKPRSAHCWKYARESRNVDP